VRNRKLPFASVVSYFLNQIKGAHERELDDAFDALWPTQRVSAAAFCKARKNLSPSAFDALNARLMAQIGAALPQVRFGGLRVFAVDGTTLNLPALPVAFRHFGGNARAAKPLPMARFSALVEVGSQLVWHSVLQPYCLGEGVAAADHLEHVPEHSVTLYDRGYPSFFLFALHQQHKRDVCMRIPRGFSPETDALFAGGPSEAIVTLKPPAEALKLCKEHGVPAAPIILRAVRVALPSQVEVLLTSLTDATQFPAADFGALYHRRWTIEEVFKELKSRLQMENWTGRSVLSIKQDVAARVLTKNLVAYVIAKAQQQVDAKLHKQRASGETPRDRRVNHTAALHLCKCVLLAYLLRPTVAALQPLIDEVAHQTHIVRSARSFPRTKHRGKSNRYPLAYKQGA
jgi:hypothetical protein